MNATTLAYAISLTLGDHADDFDIPAIIEDIRDAYPLSELGTIDDIPGEEYWDIVKRHDTTA